jgi:5-methylcytosine-specific restriction endonuclease McrA
MQPFKHKIPGKTFIAKGRRLCGQRWTNLRNKWLRCYPECARCGKPGEEVHHVIPRAHRPDLMFDLGNLQTLCKECHMNVHGEKPRF